MIQNLTASLEAWFWTDGIYVLAMVFLAVAMIQILKRDKNVYAPFRCIECGEDTFDGKLCYECDAPEGR